MRWRAWMDNFSAGQLSIEVRKDATNNIRLDWKGKSNDRQPSVALAPFFSDVAKHATASGVGIEMHFEMLEHFNSSTITALIQLIQDLREKRVRLVLVF